MKEFMEIKDTNDTVNVADSNTLNDSIESSTAAYEPAPVVSSEMPQESASVQVDSTASIEEVLTIDQDSGLEDPALVDTMNLGDATPATDPYFAGVTPLIVPTGPTEEERVARAAQFPIEQYPDDWYWAFNGATNSMTMVRLYTPNEVDGAESPRGIGFNAADGGGFVPLGDLVPSVILRQVLDPKGQHNKACLVINASQLNESMDKWQTVLTSRLIAETNAATLQVIPYIVLMNEEGEIATYLRGMSGGEAKLHQMLSAGWGGHIDSAVTTTLEDLIVDEAARELEEEAGMTSPDLKNRIRSALKGAIKLYSDAKAVDSVHIGIGIVLRVHEEELTKFEEDVITQVYWQTPEELQSLADGTADTEDGNRVLREVETWSKIMVGYINQVANTHGWLKPI